MNIIYIQFGKLQPIIMKNKEKKVLTFESTQEFDFQYDYNHDNGLIILLGRKLGVLDQ